MSTYDTEKPDEYGSESRSKASGILSTITRRGRDGSLMIVAGSAILVWALRSWGKSRRRTTILAPIALAIIGAGVRQRRMKRREGRIETEADVRRDEAGEKRTSDEAHVEREEDLGAGRNADETASVYQSASEPNPRGMSDRSDVEADAEGDIDFVEGKEPGTHRETHLEDEDAHDTRLHPDDDAQTEVDLSEAAMADEVSEAAGPQPEQAYPAREGTDPEPTSANAPEQAGGGAAETADSESEDAERGDGSEEPSVDREANSGDSREDGSNDDTDDTR